MSTFKALLVQQFPSHKETTAEERYWGTFKKNVVVKAHAKVR
jgi:hypothetical protein